jgi:hypothetical protein
MHFLPLNGRLTLNARVEISPEVLKQTVSKVLHVKTKGNPSSKIVALQCLSPGSPNPTYRFSHVVPVY